MNWCFIFLDNKTSWTGLFLVNKTSWASLLGSGLKNIFQRKTLWRLRRDHYWQYWYFQFSQQTVLDSSLFRWVNYYNRWELVIINMTRRPKIKLNMLHNNLARQLESHTFQLLWFQLSIANLHARKISTDSRINIFKSSFTFLQSISVCKNHTEWPGCS